MPKIAQREYSERSLNPLDAAQIDPSIAATSGKMFIEVGKGMEDVASKLEAAHSLAEETKATNQLNSRVAEIKSRAATDQDYSEENLRKYHTELESAVNDSSSALTLPSAKSAFMSDAQSKTQIEKYQINEGFRKKMITDAKTQFDVSMTDMMHQYVTADNEAMKTNAILKRDTLIDRMVYAGFMTRPEAAQAMQDQQVKWDTAHVNYDAEVRPDFALKELQKGDEGFYKGVSPEIRAEGIRRASTRQLKIERTQKEAVSLHLQKTEDLTTRKLLYGDLKMPELESLYITKQIRPKYFHAAEKALGSPSLTHKSNPGSYLEMIDMMTDPKSKPEDIKEKILTDMADGKLSTRDAQNLASLAIIPDEKGNQTLKQKAGDLEGILNEKARLDKDHKENTKEMKSLFGMITSFFQKDSDKAAEGIQAVAHEVAQGGDLTKAREVAKKFLAKQVLQDHPEIAKLPKEGAIAYDRAGNKIRMYPDGTYEDVKK